VVGLGWGWGWSWGWGGGGCVMGYGERCFGGDNGFFAWSGLKRWMERIGVLLPV